MGALGRDVRAAGGFQDLLANGLIDVVRPDLLRFGITGARRIAAMAETYYVAVAPRHEGSPIATAAALHVAASLPNFFIQHVPFPAAEKDRAMRGVTPALSACRRPLHRRLAESGKASCVTAAIARKRIPWP